MKRLTRRRSEQHDQVEKSFLKFKNKYCNVQSHVHCDVCSLCIILTALELFTLDTSNNNLSVFNVMIAFLKMTCIVDISVMF